MAAILQTSYLQALHFYRQKYAQIPAIADQIDTVTSITVDLAAHKLPSRRFRMLGLDVASYSQAFLMNFGTPPQQIETELHRLDHLLHNFRNFVARTFGIWALFNVPFMRRWHQLFPDETYLEIMAGNGLFTFSMQQFGQTSIATDDRSWGKTSLTASDPWVPIQTLDALTAIRHYGQTATALVMIWSQDHNPIDQQVLNCYRQYMAGKLFFVVGEKGAGGATNSQGFWEQANLVQNKRIAGINQIFPHFDLIQDQVYCVR
ncbi:hypothetical protein ACNAN0_06695 [Agrilactobacillus fermenti]|uniref:hypothetical protein n=1 Tax=Agrilactobacillus fermenti TaxID=2586909 RepID=UPI001E53AF87|nr:hypothetical protein [Agrilactobacillus fermenti]MCD2255835.1 hypothetical protein [Agrilactobacillus fermenti]